MRQAGVRDDQVGRGEIIGPLHGFPHAVKDLAWVKGIASTSGSPILKDFVPAEDALFVERLRAAGAIFIGKTNSPEFGKGSHTVNPVYGATLNAYDQTRSAGGSSGGAAVALALRMVPLADGGDPYGGSLRNPAGWNNVFGFRTSSGVVPVASPEVWSPTMGVVGPMARSIADLALLLSVQAGYDRRAPLSVAGDGTRFLAPLNADLRGKRIAWLGDFNGFAPYESGVLEVCRAALTTFEQLGCVVEEAVPDYPPEAVWQALLELRAWQAGSGLVEFYNDPAKRALMKPEVIFEIESGMRLSAYEVAQAGVVRSEWSAAVRRLLDRYDYLVAPTAQVFPFAVEEPWPRQIAGQEMTTYHEWMKAVFLITMSGCPALAVPAGFGDQGLPIGLQIVAPVREDMACLELGQRAYEAATDWTTERLPPLLAKP